MEIFKDLSQIEDPNSLVNGQEFTNSLPSTVQYTGNLWPSSILGL